MTDYADLEKRLLGRSNARGGDDDMLAAVAAIRDLTRKLEEARVAMEPFAKAHPVMTGFDPADGNTLYATHHKESLGLHDWIKLRTLYADLSRALPSQDETT